ncbi:MAG: OmpA family protein [Marinilabiliaceae bacterium]|nr:OmpA family protein [Marinilabiliaceae bacterium]
MIKLIMMHRIIIITLAVLATADINAQYASKNKRAIRAYEEAVNYYEFGKYTAALNGLNTAKLLDPNFTEAYILTSEVYYNIKEYENHISEFSKAISLDSTRYVAGYFLAAESAFELDKFDLALWFLNKYKQFSKQTNRKMSYDAQGFERRISEIRDIMSHPVPFNPRPACKTLEKPYDTYFPSLTLDGNEMVVTMLLPRDTTAFKRDPIMIRQRGGSFFQEDFYFVRKVDGEWQAPKPLTSINTDSNEGAQALSADGNWMFFTACGRPDSYGSCDLYFSRRIASGWSKPINVGAPINTSGWESQPCFSADGQTLFFVSNRPGGKGGRDIWSSQIVGFRTDGLPRFSMPKNLGDSINSRRNESTPFLHADGRTLYFSSDGHPGLGGEDIFYSQRNDSGVWSRPKNIGYPINTKGDDNSLRVSSDGKTGYYASEVETQWGKTLRVMEFDMPQISRPKTTPHVKGHVFNAKTQKPIGAELELIDLATGKLQTHAYSSSASGSYIVNLPTGRDYALIVSHEGYLFFSQNFSTSNISDPSQTIILDVPLSPIVKDEKITLRNIFFDTDSDVLKEESFIELGRIVEFMKKNPKIHIEIGGHTDNVGSAEYNLKLSQARATSTKNYIVEHGIDANRITCKGYGLTQPIAKNTTEQGRALNRRIEAKVVKIVDSH